MGMYRLIMVIGAVAAIGLVAGCGSSGEEATSAPLTKAKFIKQADAICTKATREREAAAEAWRKELPGGSEEATKKLEDGLREVIAPALKTQAEELETLTPPESEKADVRQMIASLSQASQAMEEAPKKALQSRVPQFEHEASDYGLKSCSQAL
jgi:hypothetical protein